MSRALSLRRSPKTNQRSRIRERESANVKSGKLMLNNTYACYLSIYALHRNVKRSLVSRGRVCVRFADLTHTMFDIFDIGLYVDLDDPDTTEE